MNNIGDIITLTEDDIIEFTGFVPDDIQKKLDFGEYTAVIAITSSDKLAVYYSAACPPEDVHQLQARSKQSLLPASATLSAFSVRYERCCCGNKRGNKVIICCCGNQPCS